MVRPPPPFRDEFRGLRRVRPPRHAGDVIEIERHEYLVRAGRRADLAAGDERAEIVAVYDDAPGGHGMPRKSVRA